MNTETGVSIIVLTNNSAHQLDLLLSAFIETNTHRPIEIIVVDHASDENTAVIIERYAVRVFIRSIQTEQACSVPFGINHAIHKARYSTLFFLSTDMVYTSDVLPRAQNKLSQQDNDVIGISMIDEKVGPYNVTESFKLLQRADFGAVNNESIERFDAIEFCWQLSGKLIKKLYLTDDFFSKHTEGLSRQPSTPEKTPMTLGYQDRKQPSLRVLFVLPQPIDSNCGYHVQRLADGLKEHGVECIAAVPKANNEFTATQGSSAGKHGMFSAPSPSLLVCSYAEIQKNGISFSNGQGPDIVHAWTPREGVRQFVTSLTSLKACPLVIHLEDNEEYLTETAVGRSFAELEKLSQKELDKIIPNNRYHPVHGRKWLEQARGLTMIIGTLEKFNFSRLPSLTILPPPDERLFYPRPINWELRIKLNIPENHVVLVYNGNVHAGNRDEVLTLYKAVQLLNQQGTPATLIRTGINSSPLTDGDDTWIKQFEKPLGWVCREDLPDIMAAADMFVQPGKPGPFNDYRIPCKLPEYFAMGRPVILPRTNIGLLTVHGLDAFILDMVNAEGIAVAVQEIHKNKELAEKLAEGGVDFYLRQISIKNIADELNQFFVKATGNSAADRFIPKNPEKTFANRAKDEMHSAEFLQMMPDKDNFEIKNLEAEKQSLVNRNYPLPVIDPFCLRNPEYIWKEKASKDFGIIVFGHTRLNHIKAVLESLMKQNAIRFVHFWMDGFQGKSDLKRKTDAVFDMVRTYPVASIRRHSGQLGFRKILIQGLVEMCREFENILVLEDDCFPTRDAVKIFRDEIRQIADNDRIFSVYGHHFLTPSEGDTCPRFQGWGWGTTRRKLLPVLRQLIDCYSMTEERYLEFVNKVLTQDIKSKIDVTPPRYPSQTLTKFFAWDETVCLLAALNNQVHKPTKKRTIYNCGMGNESAHFLDIEIFRKPAFNLVSLNEVWDYF